MESDKIKELILSGTAISDSPKESVHQLLLKQTANVFIKNGVHRSMSEEAFQQEVGFCATMLYADITGDPLYSRLRCEEIPYIFGEGVKGRLGNDKDIVMSYKNLVRWIEGYVRSPQYKEACKMVSDELSKRRRLAQSKPPSDFDAGEFVRQSYERYAASMDRSNNREDVKSVGDVIGLSLFVDYGGVKIRWLTENGYAKEGDKLEDIYARAYENGGEFVKV